MESGAPGTSSEGRPETTEDKSHCHPTTTRNETGTRHLGITPVTVALPVTGVVSKKQQRGEDVGAHGVALRPPDISLVG